MAGSEVTTILGKGSSFDGKLTFEGTVRIDGVYKGEIDTRGTLVVDKTAEVNAEIRAGNVVIEGQVHGQITAAESIDIEGSELTLELWRHIVYLNVTTMDTYFHGIGAVADGECTAREMVAAIEADEFSPEGIDKLDN